MLYDQLSLKGISKEEGIRRYVQLERSDGTYDWKVRLKFYGKVVDENNQPVTDASARLEWNTVGVPSGTEYQLASSDTNGVFSLSDVYGKILGVRVEKSGYYTVEGGNGGAMGAPCILSTQIHPVLSGTSPTREIL